MFLIDTWCLKLTNYVKSVKFISYDKMYKIVNWNDLSIFMYSSKFLLIIRTIRIIVVEEVKTAPQLYLQTRIGWDKKKVFHTFLLWQKDALDFWSKI